MKRIVVGIAGFIGSGKSTVARFFEKFGAFSVDADHVVDVLYQPGREGFQRIQDFFGNEYITKKGFLNRKKLAKVVFSDPKKLKILNGLIHPLVMMEAQKIIDKSKANFVVLEATYFERAFLRRLISHLVWVDTSPDIAYLRLEGSRHLTREMFDTIRRFQIKPEGIDFVIHNDGTLQDLENTIRELSHIISLQALRVL